MIFPQIPNRNNATPEGSDPTEETPMKIRLGKVLIDTQYIVAATQKSPSICQIQFTSGNTLDVVCGIKSTNRDMAVFDGDSSEFLDYIENIDKTEKATL